MGSAGRGRTCRRGHSGGDASRRSAAAAPSQPLPEATGTSPPSTARKQAGRGNRSWRGWRTPGPSDTPRHRPPSPASDRGAAATALPARPETASPSPPPRCWPGDRPVATARPHHPPPARPQAKSVGGGKARGQSRPRVAHRQDAGVGEGCPAGAGK